MKLNLGCGQYRAPIGWINIDHPSAEGDPDINPDIYCNIIDLPFKDAAASRIYMGHVIEHLSQADMYAAFGEIDRVLAPDGILMIVSPDMDRINAMEEVPEWLQEAMRTDNNGRKGEHHLWKPTERNVLNFLEHEAWDAHAVDLQNVQNGWPLVAYTEWQFAIVARSM